jgi:hypothetical protein
MHPQNTHLSWLQAGVFMPSCDQGGERICCLGLYPAGASSFEVTQTSKLLPTFLPLVSFEQHHAWLRRAGA